MKKNNTIDLEIERAASVLKMSDFFFAVKHIRINGVPMYDEEHDRTVMMPVDLAELAKFDPEAFDADDSLDATLYGVFEAMTDPSMRDCQTRKEFEENYRDLRRLKKLNDFDVETRAYVAMVMTLEGWLRFPMEAMYSDPRFLPSEEEVIERVRQIEAGEKVS